VYTPVRVISVLRGELNEGEVGYYYNPYHRMISGISMITAIAKKLRRGSGRGVVIEEYFE
jgi:hypothetical protein